MTKEEEKKEWRDRYHKNRERINELSRKRYQKEKEAGFDRRNVCNYDCFDCKFPDCISNAPAQPKETAILKRVFGVTNSRWWRNG